MKTPEVAAQNLMLLVETFIRNDIQHKDFPIPKSILANSKTYVDENDLVSEFLAELYEESRDNVMVCSDVIADLEDYADKMRVPYTLKKAEVRDKIRIAMPCVVFTAHDNRNVKNTKGEKKKGYATLQGLKRKEIVYDRATPTPTDDDEV
jgi:hypothetical protein